MMNQSRLQYSKIPDIPSVITITYYQYYYYYYQFDFAFLL